MARRNQILVISRVKSALAASGWQIDLPSHASFPTHPDGLIALIATAQHGVVARSQLLAAGLSPAQVHARLRSGHLIALYVGVYAVGHIELTRQARMMAAVLAGGPRAVLSHRSAAVLRRLIEPIAGPVHVIAPGGGRFRDGIRFHQTTLHSDERSHHLGIPATSVERTLLDLCPLVSPKQLNEAFDEADSRGWIDSRALRAICDRATTAKGSGRLRRLLDTRLPAIDDLRSPLERRFMRFCVDRGLPSPAANVPFAGYLVDLMWPKQRLVVELDSWRYHRTRKSFETDRKRDAAVQMAGGATIRVTDRRLRSEPDALEREIRALLATGSDPGRSSMRI